MNTHEGETCRGCGTPLLSPDERDSGLCDPCYAWQGVVRGMQPAITYAAREASHERAKRVEQWRKRMNGLKAGAQ